ncbi:MAG: YlmC/YmxH family sporulation protein [Clostridia bacterium]|nr:YlmC/YmxH family sporulation protein [Clostridia bacterium]
MTKKTVVNVADGRTLGYVCDMAFGANGCVLGFVVPGKKSFFRSITSGENVFVPWNRIVKIGSDVMLVSLASMPQGAPYKNACTFEANQEEPKQDEALQQTVYHDE